jgi:hypothetical protein
MVVLVAPCFSKPHDPGVRVKPGDWAKYIGSFPYEEYEWMLVSIVSVYGTRVNLSLSYGIRYPYRMSESGYSLSQHQRFIQTDVESGLGNLFLLLIPCNLTVGDIIPGPPLYPKLIVNGVESKEYAGLNRAVISATYSNISWYGDGILYWDKESGLLVEILAKVGNLYVSSLRLVETDIWSVDLMHWITKNLMFLVLGPVSVILHVVLLLMLVRKPETSYRVTHPRMGKVLISVGLLLLVNGTVHFTLFDQLVSCVSIAFSFVFFVVGVLIHTGAWANRTFKVDVGTILMSLSVTLLGSFVACAIYREMGAVIPYLEIVGITHPLFYLKLETVFLYPHAWLASLLAMFALSFFMCGILFKTLHRSEACKSNLRVRA